MGVHFEMSALKPFHFSGARPLLSLIMLSKVLHGPSFAFIARHLLKSAYASGHSPLR